MKIIMLLALCLLISLPGVASDKTNSLVLKGLIRETIGIDYEICLINSDESCTSIVCSTAYKFYKIILETGRSYKITFTKKEFTKTLYVNADNVGIFYIDIDFKSKANAHLIYDYHKRQYNLKVLPGDYAQCD